VKKLVLTFCGMLAVLGASGQIDFSRYFDDNALPFLNTDDHLDVHFKWDMKGMIQAQINEGLNNLAEDKVPLAQLNFEEAIKLDSTLWLSYYYRGVCHKKLKAFKNAEKDFRVCMRLQPKQAEPYLELGEIYHERKRFTAARDLYEEAIDADPKLVHAYYNLGHVELAAGDARKALKLYQKCNEIAPNFPDAYMAQGVLKFKVRKNDNQSIAFFDQALAVDSTFSQAYFWRGMAYMSLNQSQKCLSDWNKVIAFNPSNSFLIMMRGYLRIEMNEFDYAFADLRKALMSQEVDENRFVSGQTLMDKRIDLQSLANYLLRNGYGLKDETFTLIKKGFCLELSGREKEALRAASQAERLEPSATVYYTRAVIYEHLKKHDSAFYDYGKALRYDKDIFDAHKKRGIYWYELKNYAKSYEHFNAMFRLQPESPVAYRLRGLIRSHEKNFQGAIEDLAKFIKTDSSDFEALRTSAVCKASLGDGRGANEDLRRILYFDTRNWTLYGDVATNYLSLQDTTKAMDILYLYVKNHPLTIYPHLELVRIHIARKQWTEAKTWIEAARKIPPTGFRTLQQSFDIFYLRGLIHFHETEYDQAIDQFGKGLEVIGGDYYGRRAIYQRAVSYYKKGDVRKAINDMKTIKTSGFMDAESLYNTWNAKTK
jgi:tetratricopeptide (TPR) repeat protein